MILSFLGLLIIARLWLFVIYHHMELFDFQNKSAAGESTSHEEDNPHKGLVRFPSISQLAS